MIKAQDAKNNYNNFQLKEAEKAQAAVDRWKKRVESYDLPEKFEEFLDEQIQIESNEGRQSARVLPEDFYNFLLGTGTGNRDFLERGGRWIKQFNEPDKKFNPYKKLFQDALDPGYSSYGRVYDFGYFTIDGETKSYKFIINEFIFDEILVDKIQEYADNGYNIERRKGNFDDIRPLSDGFWVNWK
jgi:hypothetical protein